MRPVLAFASLVVLALPVRAQSTPAELPVELAIDIPVTAGATALWLGTELFKEALAPTSCRWCDTNVVDMAARDALRWDDIELGDTVSNVAVASALPASVGVLAVAASVDGSYGTIPADLLLVAEATTIAAAVNQVLKLSFARERPFIFALELEEKRGVRHPSDSNLSFYSGHSSLAFALAVSSGTIATMRGYSWAPWVWAVGLPVAAATGYLRLAADRHWLSDVVVGAVVGAAIGFAVPFFFHAPTSNRGATSPALAVPLVAFSIPL